MLPASPPPSGRPDGLELFAELVDEFGHSPVLVVDSGDAYRRCLLHSTNRSGGRIAAAAADGDGVAAPAVLLGGEHRGIGSAHQAVHVVAVGGMQRNADADADGDRAAVDGDRFLHRPHDPSGDECCVLGRADRRQGSSRTRRRPAARWCRWSGRLRAAAWNGLQNEIARLVAVAIVDGLETVEVAEQHREARAGRLRGDERVAQPDRRTAPGWRARSARRRRRARRAAALRALALGDVEHQAGDRGPGARSARAEELEGRVPRRSGRRPWS